jgi:hypothetical protein
VKPFQSKLKYPKLDFKNGKIEVKGQIYFWWRPQLQFALYVKRHSIAMVIRAQRRLMIPVLKDPR